VLYGPNTTYCGQQGLIVAYPPLPKVQHPRFQVQFGSAYEAAAKFGRQSGDFVDFMKTHLLDAGNVCFIDGCDGQGAFGPPPFFRLTSQSDICHRCHDTDVIESRKGGGDVDDL
jgi:hypothetical protein